ncbi:hypothetical protein Tco_0626565 [Tanacetum coccineum]|uniref:Uncharacterized protein n=1 Tax=Tanacetum coccineum TaxID=301880 RepID=A0ABQ4WJY3_9ASTR
MLPPSIPREAPSQLAPILTLLVSSSSFYPESYDGEDEMLDEGENWGIDPLEFYQTDMWTTILQAIMNGRNLKMKNRSNTAIDSFFKAYDVRNIEKESEQGQTKRKDNNNDDKQPNKRRCKAEKFEAIQY